MAWQAAETGPPLRTEEKGVRGGEKPLNGRELREQRQRDGSFFTLLLAFSIVSCSRSSGGSRLSISATGGVWWREILETFSQIRRVQRGRGRIHRFFEAGSKPCTWWPKSARLRNGRNALEMRGLRGGFAPRNLALYSAKKCKVVQGSWQAFSGFPLDCGGTPARVLGPA